MPNIQHLELPINADRDAPIGEWVSRVLPEAKLGLLGELVVLTESKARAALVQRRLAKLLGGALPAGFCGTVDTWVTTLAARPNSGLRVCPKREAERLLAAAMQQVNPNGMTRGSLLHMRQALSRLAVALPAFNRDDVLLSLELDATGDDPALERRLGLVRQVYAVYKEQLDTMGLVDEDDIEDAFASKPQVLSQLRLLVIDQLHRLGPAQKRFLNAAIAAATHVLILSPAGEALQLRAAADVRQWASAHALAQPIKAAQRSPIDPDIHLFADERDERRWIVHRIKTLAKQGVELHHIGVVCPASEQLQALLNEFKLAGIPASHRLGTPLASTPPVAGVLALLRVARDGYPREATLAALNNRWCAGLQQLLPSTEHAFKQLSTFAALARKARVVGGGAHTSLTEGWGRVMEAAIKRGLEERPEAYAEMATRQQQVLAGFAPLLEKLETIRQPRTPKAFDEFVDELTTLLGTAERAALAFENARGPQRSFAAEANVRAVQRFSRWLEDRIRGYDLVAGDDRPRELSFNLQQLEDDLAAESVIQAQSGGVELLSLLEARGSAMPVLFAAGLVDGVFPFTDPENIYLPRRIAGRTRISDGAVRQTLSGDINPVDEYRFLLATTLAAPTLKNLFISGSAHYAEAECGPARPLEAEAAQNGWQLPTQPTPPPKEAASWPALQLNLADHLAEGGTLKTGDPEAPSWVEGALRAAAINLLRDSIEVTCHGFDGLLDERARKVNRIVQRFEDGKPPNVSPSFLDTYAKCPLRTLFSRALEVEPLDRPDDEVRAWEKGTLLHAALEDFFLAIRQDLMGLEEVLHVEVSGCGELPVLDIALWEEVTGRDARKLLGECFVQAAAELPVESMAWQRWVERVVESLTESATRRSELSSFLIFELEMQAQDVFPLLLEYRFGDDQTDCTASSLGLKDHKGEDVLMLRGSIDRVDVVVKEGKATHFLVRDYKSGTSSYTAAVNKGYALQLPLYASAVERDLPDLELGGFLYHKLDGKIDRDHALCAPAEIRALFGRKDNKKSNDPQGFCASTMDTVIPAMAKAMQEGQYHSSVIPGGYECGYCDYRSICALREEKRRVYGQAPVRGALAAQWPLYAGRDVLTNDTQTTSEDFPEEVE